MLFTGLRVRVSSFPPFKGKIMSHINTHCADCLRELGKEYREVHMWLDELFVKLGPKHRDARHHEGGIEEARKLFGEEGAKAAEIHIKEDCGGIVPTKKQAQMWSLFGSEGMNIHGESYLTDEQNIDMLHYGKDLGDNAGE